jgi:hypothetical protein
MKTEKEIAYGYKDPGLISKPHSEIIPAASALFSAIEVKYGPMKRLITVVEKAELAQSYKYQLRRTPFLVRKPSVVKILPYLTEVLAFSLKPVKDLASVFPGILSTLMVPSYLQ